MISALARLALVGAFLALQVASVQAQATGKVSRSVYMDDLVRVSDAGFMREYVWRYYRRQAWGAQPADLRIPEFTDWAHDHLASHVPFTGAALQYPAE